MQLYASLVSFADRIIHDDISRVATVQHRTSHVQLLLTLVQYHYQKLVQENLSMFESALTEPDFRMKMLFAAQDEGCRASPKGFAA